MLNLAAGTVTQKGADTYLVNNSLRFRSSASAYLSKTLTNSNSSFTFSGWFKFGSMLGTNSTLFAVDASNRLSTGSDSLILPLGGTTRITTTAVFRDPSAWYHIVLTRSGGQGGTTSSWTIYVNNQSVGTYTGTGGTFLSAATHYIGQKNTGEYYDGYMSDVYLIDGQSLTPSSFGYTHPDTGVWRPKAYTGTYGTNGFYLPFSDNSALTTSSNAGLGKDFSGNGNYWTTNNISITSGTTYDSMTDVPTLTSATAGNYAVLNPLVKGVAGFNGSNTLTFSNGNLTASISATAGQFTGTVSTIAIPTTGKWYFEAVNAVNNNISVGLSPSYGETGSSSDLSIRNDGTSVRVSGTAITTITAYGAGDVVGVAYDADAHTVQYYRNGTANGTSTSFTPSSSYPYYPFVVNYTSNSVATVDFNFGQRPFAYTPPTGYVALNTYNLSTSTILQANKYMDATLYTGNGSTQSITNAGSFKPDLVMIRARSISSNGDVFDSVRGATKGIYTSGTVAESTWSGVTSFDSNGFSLGSNTGDNTNAATYVGWQWQAGQGTTSSNTSGSITSTVSVNATAGFSIVTYTGTGANATVGHGLGVAPKMMIVKSRTGAVQWLIYHASLTTPTTAGLFFTTAAQSNAATYWNSTQPTSTVFSVGTDSSVNTSAATYVAYCWAEIEGFSKFGSYTGNGSADGTFVYTGFRPKFVLTKNASAVDNWSIFNSADIDYNSSAYMPYVEPDTTIAETQISSITIDILSNGFKVRGSGIQANGSGNTIIYAAFAENPFKYSNAR